ncbi:MAG: hypothetical protein AVDCRST_MAG37-3702 [uncultured Rubrobacteraceae bacterium]|uniref:Uncharacterized protein n=1 Tax=uncultured Rubrobacteraceae bacterium TaxID=349277 RepID=A0A6J4R0E9_9ACTN|nr:MAG: hypothetical protein AVDCRST_MAG37-3702 [uncultured Rubrobacteraceae bacterium]
MFVSAYGPSGETPVEEVPERPVVVRLEVVLRGLRRLWMLGAVATAAKRS